LLTPSVGEKYKTIMNLKWTILVLLFEIFLEVSASTHWAVTENGLVESQVCKLTCAMFKKCNFCSDGDNNKSIDRGEWGVGQVKVKKKVKLSRYRPGQALGGSRS
jgi:hypothetical protein